MHNSVAILLYCARFNDNKGTMVRFYWHKQKKQSTKKASTSCVAISKTDASFILGRIYLLTQIFNVFFRSFLKMKIVCHIS